MAKYFELENGKRLMAIPSITGGNYYTVIGYLFFVYGIFLAVTVVVSFICLYTNAHNTPITWVAAGCLFAAMFSIFFAVVWEALKTKDAKLYDSENPTQLSFFE